jgi:glycosyltransferase involved in cell wall biosynthesis
MLVGIDASRAVRPVQTGTETYSRQLIHALVDRPTDYFYRLYVDRAPSTHLPTSVRSEIREIHLTRAWTHVRLAWEVFSRAPDLLFVPSHVMPLLCRVPTVVTIHDLGYLWYRSAYRPLAWLALHLGTLHNARGAARIVVDSQATARDLEQHFRVDPSRMRVAYLGGPAVEVVPRDDNLLRRWQLPERYLLFVGTLQPRKNVPRLLRAFAALDQKETGPVALALAGQPGKGASGLHRLAANLGIADRVRWLGYVSADDRRSLMASATAFVFPSLYEGFGLPALEAMAWGAPVIASNASSLPEVVGDSGLLVDPLDVRGLAHAMGRLLSDSDLRNGLIEAGRQRATEFTWDRCATVVESAFAEGV